MLPLLFRLRLAGWLLLPVGALLPVRRLLRVLRLGIIPRLAAVRSPVVPRHTEMLRLTAT
jgi:hypothetical protein